MKLRFPPEYSVNCARSLERALRHVPAYREWNRFDPGPKCPVDDRYALMPAITKADIRKHTYAGLIPVRKDRRNGFKKGAIELVKTSGTTNEKVTLVWNQSWWDASEKASWRLNSHAEQAATGRHREAILASPVCVGVLSKTGRQLSMGRRRLGRFLFLNEIASPAEWTTGHLDRMINELAVFRPVVLEANPALLAKLARHINKTGRKVFNPELIVLTYEFPSRIHLRQIKRAFSVPVASSYGSTETGYVFMECERGNFHQNTEFCRVDIQPFRKQYAGNQDRGRLLVTTFHNEWFSMVRFNVGDIVRILPPMACPCGRRMGYTAKMEGRAADITFRTNGCAVTVNQLDAAVNDLDWVMEYQLEQLSPRKYFFRVVPGVPANRGLENHAKKILKGLYGANAELSICFEEIILPEISGKHRLAKTSFPVDIDSLFESN